MANRDGSSARQVTHTGPDAENPTMTADGQWIVYSSDDPRTSGFILTELTRLKSCAV